MEKTTGIVNGYYNEGKNINYSCGIDKLEEELIYARDYNGQITGEIVGKKLPSQKEMMNKINEIIDVLDRICGKRY